MLCTINAISPTQISNMELGCVFVYAVADFFLFRISSVSQTANLGCLVLTSVSCRGACTSYMLWTS